MAEIAPARGLGTGPRRGGPGLLAALSGRAVKTRVLVVVSVTLVGFLLTAQFRARQEVTEQLAAESQKDLTRIFSSLNEESAALRDEISELRLELAALESSAARDQVAREAARRQLEELEILAGVVAARGPGVSVRITDPMASFEFELLIDLVQELRDAGAEAIAVNGRRVGASTAFSESRGRITIDGEAIRAPYDVVAIGDPGTLEVGLRIPGGAVDTLDALAGVRVGVERRGEVSVPALEEPPSFDVADPVK